MSERKTPWTPGRRAARKLQSMGFAHDCNGAVLARIIDEETEAPAMAELLREIEPTLSKMLSPYAGQIRTLLARIGAP